MTVEDPGPVPTSEKLASKVQLHVQISPEINEWLRLRAFRRSQSRAKAVEAILRSVALVEPEKPV